MIILLRYYQTISLKKNFVKLIYLLGDFNVNLLNYNEHNQTNKFFYFLPFNSFISLLLQPTRIIIHSNTLIDNIFSNVIDSDITPNTFTPTVSDYLLKFSIIPNMFSNMSGNKSNIYEEGQFKFDRENFILDCFSVDWEVLFKVDDLNTDKSTTTYFDKISMLLDTYAPLKRTDKNGAKQ